MSICLAVFSQEIHQELIIGSYSDIQQAKSQLEKLNIYLIENSALDTLKKKYGLQTQIRRIGPYEVVSIEPIDSLALKNRLLIRLDPFFPDIFAINSKLPISMQKPKGYQVDHKSYTTSAVTELSKKDIIDQMGLQWFAILMLSLTGLVLSVFRRNKVHYVQKIQKLLGVQQEQIEKEIKQMEDVHA